LIFVGFVLASSELDAGLCGYEVFGGQKFCADAQISERVKEALSNNLSYHATCNPLNMPEVELEFQIKVQSEVSYALYRTYTLWVDLKYISSANVRRIDMDEYYLRI
jgi:hypothetical protein